MKNKLLMNQYIFLCLLGAALWLTPAQAMAQSNDEQLAQQYFANGEFDKAAILYERLIVKNPNSFVYDNLLVCYYRLNHLDDAEKLTRKQAKKFGDMPIYAVDHALVLQKQGNEKAKKAFEKIIKDLPINTEIINRTATAFSKRELYEYALEAYKRGRSLTGDPNLWHQEMGQLYAKMGQKSDMLDEFLDGLLFDEALGENIQAQLQPYMADSSQAVAFKTMLMKKIQKNPSKDILIDMLVWYYIQMKDWNGAFIQLRAMDKRNKMEGKRVLDLANMELSNNAFDVSANHFQYVIDLGREARFYIEARQGQLDARNRKIQSGNYSASDLVQIEQDYKSFIGEQGKGPSTVKAMRDLATVYAFYMDSIEKSIAVLNEVVAMLRISPQFIAECKLLLGDIYLLEGNYYDPVLLYGQVDKDFKEDPLAQEAKFRNARLSYYKGDFEWAQGQLDVLKTATTQLISNNSIELSLMIQDNTGLDTSDEAMRMYAAADLLIYQNKFSEANKKLDSIPLRFPEHSLTDEIHYAKARMLRKQKLWSETLKELEKVYTTYSTDILADNALFDAAEIYELNLGNKDKARELYEKVFMTYPGSLFSVEARKRFRYLRGDQVN
jgi:tetratricopeptide (TPR) repeat protein